MHHFVRYVNMGNYAFFFLFLLLHKRLLVLFSRFTLMCGGLHPTLWLIAQILYFLYWWLYSVCLAMSTPLEICGGSNYGCFTAMTDRMLNTKSCLQSNCRDKYWKLATLLHSLGKLVLGSSILVHININNKEKLKRSIGAFLIWISLF